MILQTLEDFLIKKGCDFTKEESTNFAEYAKNDIKPGKKEKDYPIIIYTVKNPNHKYDLKVMFSKEEGNLTYEGVYFGPKWDSSYLEGEVAPKMINDISKILSGDYKVLIIWNDKKHTKLYLSNLSVDEEIGEDPLFELELNNMRAEKTLFEKLMKKQTRYELFSWNTYEEIIK